MSIWPTNHPHRLLCPPSTHCSIFQSWVSDIWFTYIDTGAKLHTHLFISYQVSIIEITNREIRTCLYDLYRRHKIQIFIYCDCKAKLNFFNADIPYATIHRTRGGQNIKKRVILVQLKHNVSKLSYYNQAFFLCFKRYKGRKNVSHKDSDGSDILIRLQ